jgi:hypothetical protein
MSKLLPEYFFVFIINKDSVCFDVLVQNQSVMTERV